MSISTGRHRHLCLYTGHKWVSLAPMTAQGLELAGVEEGVFSPDTVV